MRFVRFLFFMMLLAVGAVAFLATRRMIHAQAPRNIAVVDKASNSVKEQAEEAGEAPSKKEALPSIEEEVLAPPGGKTSVRVEAPAPGPDTEDWNAVVKVVLVYYQDSARKAIEGVMFVAGDDTLVATAASASVAPKGIAKAIDHVLIERFDKDQGISVTQPAEFVKTNVPELIFYRLPGRLTQLRLTDKANPKNPLNVEPQESLLAQNVDFAGQRTPRRRATSVVVTALGATVHATLHVSDETKARTYHYLTRVNATLREGTPVFKDGRLAGITLVGTAQAQPAASYFLPIDQLRERCRRAYIQDATERAIEREDQAAADHKLNLDDAFREPGRSDAPLISKEPVIPAEQGQDALPASNIPSANSDLPPVDGPPQLNLAKQPIAQTPPSLPTVPTVSEDINSDVAITKNPEPAKPLVDPSPIEDDHVAVSKQTGAGSAGDVSHPPNVPVLDETPESARSPKTPVLGEGLDVPAPSKGPQSISGFPPIARAVIHLTHLAPEDTAKTLRSLFADSADGHGIVRIASNTSSRTIIISAPQDSISEIRKTVAELEDQAAQVDREALKKWNEAARASENDQERPERFRNTQDAATSSQAVAAAMGGNSLHQLQDKQDVAMDLESKELAAQVRGAQGPERDQLHSKLEELATRHFDLRQQLRLKEIDELAKRVEQLRATHGKRNEQKSQIIKRRVAELLGEESDLQWDASQHKAPANDPLQSAKDLDSLRAKDSAEAEVANLPGDVKKSKMELGKGITELIQLPNRIKTVDEFDEKLVKVSSIEGEGREIRVTGLATGRTRIVLKDDQDKRYVIDMLVRDLQFSPEADAPKASPQP